MLLHASLCSFPSVWWLRMKLQWTFAWRFVWTYAFICLFKFIFLLCKFLSMKILDCILSVCLIQKRNCQAFFPKWVYHIAFQLFRGGGWCTMLVVYGSFCPWLYFCKSCKHLTQSAVEYIFVSIWRLPMVTVSESSSVHLYVDQLWSPINLIVFLLI